MAENTIDTLQIKITAEARSAEKSIDRLVNSLMRLQGQLNGFGNLKLGAFSSSMKTLRDSMAGFPGVGNLEKGITQLQRLSRLNAEGMIDAAIGIKEISDSLKSMNGIVIPNLDGLDGMIVSVRKFGGKNIDSAVKNLPLLSNYLTQFVTSLNSVGSLRFDFTGIANLVQNISQLGGVKATQAAANLKPLKDQLIKFVSGLNGLQSLNFDMEGLNNLVSAISKLGGKSASNAAGGNIEKLAVALKNMLTTLSTAPHVSNNIIQMTQALAQLASTGGKAGTATRSLSSSFNIFSASSKKASKSAGGLAAAFGKFYATYWLLLRGLGTFKKAIDISSDLTEVQNVVDVTFGNMSEKMNEFADSALQMYGMSELTAKQIASRFQAMGVAMGFSKENMTDMSIALTQLTGDMASFWNTSQEMVATGLQSIFTGETEPLRKWGLDLSFATVEAWALSQGIDANMQKMTQMQKTLLRYQYVMANTGMVQGDFLDTIHSFHNQLILLSGGFQELGKVVGGVLTNAFKPFIEALNSVMGAIIQFAETVSNALGAIFGWKFEKGGVKEELQYGASAAEEMEDAIGGSAQKAKELNRYIAAWHEVNNMTSNDEGAGGGSGGGGGAGGSAGAGSGGEWVRSESIWEAYTSDIDSLYELGNYISNVLTRAMNDIDWLSVYESARNFGSGLADFLNGLISPGLFAALGTTIAGSLNTALYSLNSFGTTFDWTNFGISIATGINHFFSTYDFSTLGSTINVWANGLLDALISGIETLNWESIGTQIGTFLATIDFSALGSKIGRALWGAIGGGISLWKSAFDAAPIETAIVTAVGMLKFTGVGKIISAKIVTSIIAGFKGGTIANTLSTAIKALFGSSVAKNSLVLMFPKTSAVVSAIGGFFSKSIIPAVTSGIASIGTAASGAIGSLASALGISVTAAGGIIIGAIAAVIAGIVALVLNWDEVKNFFTVTIPEFFSGTVVPFFQSLPQKIGEAWTNIKEYAVQKWDEIVLYMSGLPNKIGESIENIVSWFSEIPYNIGFALGEALGKISRWAVDTYEYLAEEIPKTVEAVVNWFGELPDRAYKAISVFASNVVQWGAETYSAFNQKVSEIKLAVANWFGELPDKIYDEIIKIKDKIVEWKDNAVLFFEENVPLIVDKVIEFFEELPKNIVEVGENLIKGLWEGINNMVDWLGTNISGFVNGVIDGFKTGFDEHSPSKVAFEIGDFFTLGLANGISDRFGDIYRMITDFSDDVSSTKLYAPKLDLDVDTSKYQIQTESLNPLNVAGKIQETLDYALKLGGIIDYNRLGQAVYQAQSQAMKENPLVIGDKDIFDANVRETRRFGQRTKKNPYPIY